MTDSPNLGLPYLEAAQAQKHVTHNEALRRIDALVQTAVLDRTLTTPPVSPTDGDSYIPATGATGAWAGHASEIAAWQDGAWMFHPPSEGWRVWSAAEDALLAWSGSVWTIIGGAALLNPAPLVGVNATANTTNRLSVASPATLLNHEGAGHQLKLNKNLATDTASLLYQTGFSGRAEMGTTGDDDFHVKVSADGSVWNEAIVVNRTTGAVSFPNTSIGGGGVTDGDKGDITVSGTGSVWTIDNDAVTNAKAADVPTATFKGRTTAATGDPEDLTVAQAKSLLNLTGTNTGDQTITLTGPVTGTGAGSFATTITDDAVTYAKLQNVAANSVLARAAATSGDVGEVALAAPQLLGRGATGDVAAIVLGTNLSMSGTTLNASGGGVSDGDKGDITVSGSGATWTLDNGVVTFAKMQTIATDRLIGRDTAATGAPEEIAVNGGLEFGGAGNIQRSGLTGDVTAPAGSNATTIATNAVSNTKLADMATATFKGRITAATGDPEDLTVAQAKTLLDLTGTNSGDQSLFSTIAVSGQSNVVADATTDTLTLVAGTNVTITTDAGTDSITINSTAGGGGNTFSTIAVSGQSDVVADTGTDTLTLAAGANVTITTNAGTDTITIAAAGGSGSPGGADTQIQYNDGGAFNGSVDFTLDETTGEVAFGKWARLAEQTSDPADPPNGVALFSKALANRRLPRFSAFKGFDSFLQPFIPTTKIAWWSAAGNANATLIAMGASALTNTGTLTARNIATSSILTRTRRVGLVSAATAASVAATRNPAAQWSAGNGSGLGGLFFTALFNVSDASILAGARMFVGLQAATGAPTDVEPSTLVNCFGVGARAADTNLHIFYGGSAAQTPISLGANFPSDTTNTDLYRVSFFSPSSENGVIYYEVARMNTGDVATGTLSGTVGTVVPASTTLLTTNNYRSNGGVATAVGIDFSQIYIETEQ